ncbi:unnamed protein product [Rotaria sp. Silwood1]|nr:unnamed protein product [Rotaria sp. Silwood1]
MNMYPSAKQKRLRSQVVAFLMNKIGLFPDYRHLSQDNELLRRQLYEQTQLYQQHVQLHNELFRSRNQVEENLALRQQTAKNSQNQQSDLILFQDAQPRRVVPIEPHATNVNPSYPNIEPLQTNTVSNTNISQVLQETEEEAALRAEVAQYRQRHAELLGRYEKLNEEMKRKKIDSFESLAKYDKEAMKVFIELARLTEPIPLDGINIGLFGLTSTGKSTMLNALLGQKVADTGVGETTTKIIPYNGTKFTLWDIPGRNDEVSYFSMEYISFFKGLSRRLILIQATVKENSSMMKLLDEIGLDYDIVFNKFDKVEPEEQEEVKNQIKFEIQNIDLKQVKHVYFVSAKHPKMFDDWTVMMNHLDNPSN